jgi:hypothetical protein
MLFGTARGAVRPRPTGRRTRPEPRQGSRDRRRTPARSSTRQPRPSRRSPAQRPALDPAPPRQGAMPEPRRTYRVPSKEPRRPHNSFRRYPCADTASFPRLPSRTRGRPIRRGTGFGGCRSSTEPPTMSRSPAPSAAAAGQGGSRSLIGDTSGDGLSPEAGTPRRFSVGPQYIGTAGVPTPHCCGAPCGTDPHRSGSCARILACCG